MTNDMLKYEVQRIDGTPESILRSINLIRDELSTKKYLSENVEYSFLSEFMKCILNWIGVGDTQKMNDVNNLINILKKEDPDLASPYSSKNSKLRFYSQLNTLSLLIETYLTTDLESKTIVTLTIEDEKHERIRQLLLHLLKRNKAVTLNEINSSFKSEKDVVSKTLERDLNNLIDLHIVKKISTSPRKIYYELTPKAFSLEQALRNYKGIKKNTQSTKASFQTCPYVLPQFRPIGSVYLPTGYEIFKRSSSIETDIHKFELHSRRELSLFCGGVTVLRPETAEKKEEVFIVREKSIIPSK